MGEEQIPGLDFVEARSKEYKRVSEILYGWISLVLALAFGGITLFGGIDSDKFGNWGWVVAGAYVVVAVGFFIHLHLTNPKRIKKSKELEPTGDEENYGE